LHWNRIGLYESATHAVIPPAQKEIPITSNRIAGRNPAADLGQADTDVGNAMTSFESSRIASIDTI
jgi:hypothetical protein